MLIDAHCHLEQETYGADLAAVIARAKAAGLVGFIAVGASGVTAGADEALRLSAQDASVYAAVGIHPHEAQQAHDQPDAMAHIDRCLRHPRAVALGEVGLDYFYGRSPAAVQQQIFRRFLTMAKQHGKPLMLHIRDAHADCFAALDAEGMSARTGVVHCFTGGPQEAKGYLDRGMYLSIAGVVTFKKADALREAVRYAPLDRLLVETDCPYLAPVPYRGKRNEPAFVVETARAIAALKGCDFASLATQTSHNATRLFGLQLPLAAASGSIDKAGSLV